MPVKRQTALKNLEKIIAKAHSINGIYMTYGESHECVKIKRMWVFGSVAKGSNEPNDLDIFIEVITPNNRRRKGCQKIYRTLSKPQFLESCQTDKKLHGMFIPRRSKKYTIGVPNMKISIESFTKWLTKGMQKVSIHYVGYDSVFDTLDVKYLIYPKNTFLT